LLICFGSYLRTLKALFSCGFEPNERLEEVVGIFPERDQLAVYVGFAPIQIVAAAVLDVLKHKTRLGEDMFSNIVNLLVNVAEILVQHGARLSLDAPPLVRSNERTKPSATGDSVGATASDSEIQNRSGLKIQSNKELTQLLGSPRMTAAQTYFKELKPAAGQDHFIFHSDKHQTIENSLAPGGSDDKTCALCWKPFGLLVRKHRCRISVRFVCDECSSHRVLAGREEHRVSDGQFLLAKAEEVKEVNRRLSAAVEHAQRMVQQQQQKQQQQDRQKEPTSQRSRTATAAARLQKLEADDESHRDSLFGGILASMASSLTGSEEGSITAQSDSVAGLSSQLNLTRDQLNERGDKLTTLAEKSDKLVSASRDFASMAKELNRKSNQGFFGW
jgi:FYVE zinc finger